MPIETAEILHQFERYTGKFERAAVEAAVARREEVTPELLHILEDTVDRAAELDAEGGYMAHLYAMFLLAQFRETRSFVQRPPAASSSPIKTATPKTGRNEPCPCGSGKKYKQCCGA